MKVFGWIILLFFSGAADRLFGQMPVTYFFADQVICANDTVRLPLQLRDFINVRNFQSSIRWNPNALFFHAIEEIHPQLTSNFLINTDSTENGGLGYFWLDTSSGEPLVLADSSVLFILKFTIADGVESTEVGFGEVPTLTETVVENNGVPMQTSSTQLRGLITKNEVTAAAEIQAATTPNNGAINLTLTSGQAPFSFSWNTGATTKDLENLTPDNYRVTITDALDCIASFEYVVDLNTVIKNELKDHMIIGPNPTRDYFSIVFISTNLNVFYQYKIYNLQGHIVSQKNNIHSDFSEKVNLQNQPSGLYFLEIKTKKNKQIFRIIKK